MKLFIGSSSEALGKKVAELSGIPIGRWQLFKFGDSEVKPQIQDAVRGEDVIVFHSTSNPVNEAYMELFLLIDALRRSACGRIILAMPYYGYSRQNQQHLPGEPVSAQLMARFLEEVGTDEIITLDLHEEQLTGFFTIPMTHLSALPLLASAVGEEIVVAPPWRASSDGAVPQADQGPATTQSVIVVSPDQGGVERTRKFRDALAAEFEGKLSVDQEVGMVEKKRNLEGVHETKIVEITGDVNGKIVIIPDDVIVSGGTILHAAEAALHKGATKVYLAATHADFIEETKMKLQNSPVEKVFVTDTIAIPADQVFEKLEVVSTAELLAEQIKKM